MNIQSVDQNQDNIPDDQQIDQNQNNIDDRTEQGEEQRQGQSSAWTPGQVGGNKVKRQDLKKIEQFYKTLSSQGKEYLKNMLDQESSVLF